MSQIFLEQLDRLIRARYSLIAIPTFEEARLRRLVLALVLAPASRHAEKPVYEWSRTRGLRVIAEDGRPLVEPRVEPDTQEPLACFERVARLRRAIVLAWDLPQALAPFGQPEPVLVRRLRELGQELVEQQSALLCAAPVWPDLPDLDKDVRRLELPLPDEAETARLLDQKLAEVAELPGATVALDDGGRAQLVQALLGLTEQEIDGALAQAVIAHRGLGPAAIGTVLEEKRALLRSPSLTYTHPEPPDSLGGYAHLKQLLREIAATGSPEARAFGLRPVKGVLLVGPPGVGKDLTKRVAAAILGRPLLDLDFGAVMGAGGGVIGSGAMELRRAIAVATAMRGILGFSEFEKAVAGLEASGRSDAGETARTLAGLLAWMADQPGEVLVWATANDVRHLAPEQVRQGRFDRLVFVDLPSEADRTDILRVHLGKRGRDAAAFDLAALARRTEGFAGAELEAVVEQALLRAFLDGREVDDRDLLAAAGRIRPTAETRRAEIEQLRQWARAAMPWGLDEPTAAAASTPRLEL